MRYVIYCGGDVIARFMYEADRDGVFDNWIKADKLSEYSKGEE